jgi:hypothetical protein
MVLTITVEGRSHYHHRKAWVGGVSLLLFPLSFLALAGAPAFSSTSNVLLIPKLPQTGASAASAALDFVLAALACAWILYPTVLLTSRRQSLERSLDFLRASALAAGGSALVGAVVLAFPRPVLLLAAFSSCCALLLLSTWKWDFLLLMYSSGLGGLLPPEINTFLATSAAEWLQVRLRARLTLSWPPPAFTPRGSPSPCRARSSSAAHRCGVGERGWRLPPSQDQPRFTPASRIRTPPPCSPCVPPRSLPACPPALA